ncbi:MAG: hypothetical protein MUC49_02200 [Raineya sp.]|jgi:hypothetical protein|nr:hypothetical protein [Raineya sp.]
METINKPSENSVTVTEKELDIIAHSLGINIYHARKSKLKRDKKLPKANSFYRNYFAASKNPENSDVKIILGLCEKGLMKLYKDDGVNNIYYVTDEGKEVLKAEFDKILKEYQDNKRIIVAVGRKGVGKTYHPNFFNQNENF